MLPVVDMEYRASLGLFRHEQIYLKKDISGSI